jgi:hypothetical protein
MTDPNFNYEASRIRYHYHGIPIINRGTPQRDLIDFSTHYITAPRFSGPMSFSVPEGSGSLSGIVLHPILTGNIGTTFANYTRTVNGIAEPREWRTPNTSRVQVYRSSINGFYVDATTRDIRYSATLSQRSNTTPTRILTLSRTNSTGIIVDFRNIQPVEQLTQEQNFNARKNVVNFTSNRQETINNILYHAGITENIIHNNNDNSRETNIYFKFPLLLGDLIGLNVGDVVINMGDTNIEINNEPCEPHNPCPPSNPCVPCSPSAPTAPCEPHEPCETATSTNPCSCPPPVTPPVTPPVVPPPVTPPWIDPPDGGEGGSNIWDFLSAVVKAITGVLGNILSAIVDLADTLLNGLLELLKYLFIPPDGFFKEQFNKLFDDIGYRLPFQSVITAIGSIGETEAVPSALSASLDTSFDGETSESNAVPFEVTPYAIINMILPHLEPIRTIVIGIHLFFLMLYNYHQLYFLIRGTTLKGVTTTLERADN